MKNYGLKLGGIKSILGIPKIVIDESGNWEKYLPIYEPQLLNDGTDEQGCFIWGTENILETILKSTTGIDYNFSERFVYNGMESDGTGGDPYDAGDWICNNGLIEETLLPTPSTYDEFVQPRPLSEKLRQRGRSFLDRYDIQQDYVWNGNGISIKRKQELVTEHLRYSPLGVSVYAWTKDENGLYYRPVGYPDVHYCVLFKEDDTAYYLFDSYDQHIKKCRKDMDFGICIRYYVKQKIAVQPSVLSELINFILSWRSLSKQRILSNS